MPTVQQYRVYISNIHFDAREEDLEDFLIGNGFDPVDVFIPRDKNYLDRWKNRGFGFVEFDTERERDEAIDILDGKPGPSNRTLSVKLAEKRTPAWTRD